MDADDDTRDPGASDADVESADEAETWEDLSEREISSSINKHSDDRQYEIRVQEKAKQNAVLSSRSLGEGLKYSGPLPSRIPEGITKRDIPKPRPQSGWTTATVSKKRPLVVHKASQAQMLVLDMKGDGNNRKRENINTINNNLSEGSVKHSPQDSAQVPHDEAAISRPVVIVNWTRVFRSHAFRVDYSSTRSGYSPVSRAFRNASLLKSNENDGVFTSRRNEVLGVWEKDFENEIEKLFGTMHAFHSTDFEVAQDIEHVGRGYPGEMFTKIEYPRNISAAEKTEEAWSIITRSSFWKCVNLLKQHISKCSRSLTWKMLMSMEIENIAIQQQLMDPSVSIFSPGDGKDQHLLMQAAQLPTTPEELTVIDKIVAMASERMFMRTSDQEHMMQLVRTHVNIRNAWLHQFKQFPDPSTQLPAY
eukprot:m.11296 g.11296  ORF g.11296 m.11296 type:complete len:420 (+) comp4417_c0_seq1:329-1588(+)